MFWRENSGRDSSFLHAQVAISQTQFKNGFISSLTHPSPPPRASEDSQVINVLLIPGLIAVVGREVANTNRLIISQILTTS